MTKSTRVADLIRLVANNAVDPHKAVEKAYDWEHARALEVGKWSLAGATALLAAVASGILRQPDNHAVTDGGVLSYLGSLGFWPIASLLTAGLLILVGGSSLFIASQTERRFVLTLALVAKMIELRPFLRRAIDEGAENS